MSESVGRFKALENFHARPASTSHMPSVALDQNAPNKRRVSEKSTGSNRGGSLGERSGPGSYFNSIAKKNKFGTPQRKAGNPSRQEKVLIKPGVAINKKTGGDGGAVSRPQMTIGNNDNVNRHSRSRHTAQLTLTHSKYQGDMPRHSKSSQQASNSSRKQKSANSSKASSIKRKVNREVLDLVTDESSVGSEGEGPVEGFDNAMFPTVKTPSNEVVSNRDMAAIADYTSPHFVGVDRVWLGKRCYDAAQLRIPLSVRMTSKGVHLLLSGKAAVSLSLESAPLSAEVHILWSEIEQTSSGADPGGDESGVFFIAFSPNSAISDNDSLAKEVPVGHGKTLNPEGKSSPKNPCRYILLVFEGQAAHKRYLQVSEQSERCIRKLCFRQSCQIEDVHCFVERASSDLRLKWAGEAVSELERLAQSSRRSKRSRRASAAVPIGEAPLDNITYIVYPLGDQKYKITISNGDIRRLEPPEYMNDNLIDFKIKHLLNQQEFQEKRPKVHCFQSFFYERLSSGGRKAQGYRKVATWTKSVDIFDLEMLIVPINQHAHWSALFVLRPDLILREKSPYSNDANNDEDNKDIDSGNEVLPCIVCLDSLSMHNTGALMRRMKMYLGEEFREKKCTQMSGNEDFDHYFKAIEDMEQVTMKDIPTQDNSYDCGIYLIKYVETMLAKWPVPTKDAIQSKFKGLFDSTVSPEQITAERVKIKALLATLKPEYDEEQARCQMEERLEKQREKNMKKMKILEKSHTSVEGNV